MKMVQLSFALAWLVLMLADVNAYPVESKPLNNNPDTWNFGEGWLPFNPRNSSDPSVSALIGTDPHIKKSKITPKSIFIAPNAYTTHEQCPHGFRVDDNGKCIKTVTINQDEILAARISELFGIDENPNKNSDIDSDYYDFDDESKSDKDTGPLQINLPLAIEIDEEIGGKRVEFVIEEKFSMRNLDPKIINTTTEKVDEAITTMTPVTETTEAVTTEPSTTLSSTITSDVDETMTATETVPPSNTSPSFEETSTIETTIVEVVTESSTTITTEIPLTTQDLTTKSSSTTTLRPVKIFSVDFLPKSPKKQNRFGPGNARLKNSRDRDRLRKQKTTASGVKSNEKPPPKLYKLESSQALKKNRTRDGSKRPGLRKSFTSTSTAKISETTTEITTITPPSSQKPFWWLPKGWSIDESNEKPVLVRFWAQQPLPNDERARNNNYSRQQRVNSRMPSGNIFEEITASELESA